MRKKLHGSHDALEGRQSMDTMVDPTGRLGECFDLKNMLDKRCFFKLLMMSSSSGAFIITSKKVLSRDARLPERKAVVSCIYTSDSPVHPHRSQSDEHEQDL
ncbi:hypothetical protein O3P69_013414 [Scylla paramamosain]|uniref:Uncharacterized protein n=1 Tax=Scylla paramamosain TaxID=85552 RepID=A0AAW0U1L7_SCYPA